MIVVYFEQLIAVLIDRHLQYGFDRRCAARREGDVPKEALTSEICGRVYAATLNRYGFAETSVVNNHLPPRARLDLNVEMGTSLVGLKGDCRNGSGRIHSECFIRYLIVQLSTSASALRFPVPSRIAFARWILESARHSNLDGSQRLNFEFRVHMDRRKVAGKSDTNLKILLRGTGHQKGEMLRGAVVTHVSTIK
jgi:hypothetical protein